MTATLSLRDVKIIPQFSALSELEMINPMYDNAIKEILKHVGFDVEYPIEYVPSIHRDMQNNVGLGFRVVGEVDCNRKWLSSPLCDLTSILVAASYLDISLMRELAEMCIKSPDYESLDWEDVNICERGSYGDEPMNIEEEGWQEVEEEIRMLERMRDIIRGDCYGSV